jgi:curved DNA-binding protein CbpA
MYDSNTPNYYKALGVKPNVSDDDIKDAYEKAALKWNPDTNNKGASII